MLKKIIRGIIGGIAWGSIIACVVNVIGSQVMGLEWFADMKHGYTAQTAVAMIVGIGWVLPSAVYQDERLSMGVQVLIHMTVGFVVYFPCAFYMGWLPSAGGAGMIFASIAVMIFVAFLIWGCFYF